MPSSWQIVGEYIGVDKDQRIVQYKINLTNNVFQNENMAGHDHSVDIRNVTGKLQSKYLEDFLKRTYDVPYILSTIFFFCWIVIG